ncbi:MAG: metalloendopeptidase, partial [Bacteroidales bacterium]|nr:metalloendopeptidase [Bacteroidales bacterium]
MGKRRILDVVLLVIPAIAIILISVFYSEEAFDTPTQTFEKSSEDVYQPTIKYGIVVDSLITYSDKIKKNQNLSDILIKYDVSYQAIDQLVKRSKGIFDVRKIRSGNNFVAFCTGDSVNEKIQYFIYEESATDYVVFDLRDSVHVHRGQKEVETRIATAHGIINSSLWNALKEQNSNPFLSVVLSEVYAWEIDFFGIQKGDAFRVKYEELYVEDHKIGVGKIISARFDHVGNPYYAFYFVQDSVGDYFDHEGNSLRRTFLKA